MSEPYLRRPPFNPAYKTAGGLPGTGDILDLDITRTNIDVTSVEGVLGVHPHLKHQDIMIPAFEDGGDDVALTVFQSKSSVNQARAAMLYVHGGGQVAGNRFHFVE